jgi:hypothetical protein
MAEYYYKKSIHKQTRKLNRTQRNMYMTLTLVLVFVSGLGVYIWQQISVDNTIQQVSPVKLGAYNGIPRKEYVNEVFSFSSTTDWLFIREASSPPNKYVYYNHLSNITQFELTIYVNNVPFQPVGYITPVTIKEGKIIPGLTSPKCGQDIKNRNGSIPMVFESVKYDCDLVHSQEKIGAGVQGGSYAIQLYSSTGKLTQVGMYFIDHSPGYKPEIFNEVLTNFKLR